MDKDIFDLTSSQLSEEVKSLLFELFEDDILVESYEYKKPEVITYILNGQSPFNMVNKRILNREDVALIEFRNEQRRCDWVTLYKEINGERTLVECFVKGA